MTEIARVSLESAAEQLRDKIRSAFVELLPPEQFQQMVKAELTAFMDNNTNSHDARYNTRVSTFRSVCYDVFREHVTKDLKTLLASAEWQEQWKGGGGPNLSDAIKAWLTENAQQIVAATIQELAGRAAQTLVQRIG